MLKDCSKSINIQSSEAADARVALQVMQCRCMAHAHGVHKKITGSVPQPLITQIKDIKLKTGSNMMYRGKTCAVYQQCPFRTIFQYVSARNKSS